ncbi:MAG TPA: enoyl-CoA hydratase-related protein [Actinomycetota bacterium]|nr:enoyl-CoA hydratase-related protein [Actinomycetota bacterium]
MPIRYEVDGHVAVITFDRPDVLNAFDDELGTGVLQAVEKAAADEEVRCIVLTGSGRAFSSGEDLGALADGYEKGEAAELGNTLVDRYNPLIRAITTAPKPVVAAVNGVAAGAGASIAFACDHRVVSEKAKFVLAFVGVGLIPDAGSLWFLARMVGTSRAWALASSGSPLSAEEARDLGVVHEVAKVDGFESTWRAVAERFAAGPTRSYALTKALLRESLSVSLEEELDREVDAQTEAGRTSDHMEGVQAFLGKRRPKFEGR